MRIALFGVATPYAWELVETTKRLGYDFVCIDNLGFADKKLPNLVSNSKSSVCTALAQASCDARFEAAKLALAEGFSETVSLIDPTAVISSTSEISHGVYINANSTVASNVKIRCCVNVNRSASIGHDSEINEFSSIGPGAVIGSFAFIDRGVSIGTGAVLLPKVKIGQGAIVGAGAVVVKDVAPFEVVVGNPSRAIGLNENNNLGFTCPWH